MKALKYLLFTFLLWVVTVVKCYATWSIIVIDPKTGEIGIAGASCTNSVYGIGTIIPGKGAIIVQAMSNNEARAKGQEMILTDAPPEKILEALKDPSFDPENQQYAIVCIKYIDNPLTYTGKSTIMNKGALTARGISVQGNMLSSSDELKSILNTALKAQKDGLPLEEVLLLALEAGAKEGGDKRCGEIKASSAFLTVMKPSDDPQHPRLNLIVNKMDDHTNAVEALRLKFNVRKEQGNK